MAWRDRVSVVSEWFLRCFGRVWASGKALLASPSVWLATALLFGAGFAAGHLERSAAVRQARGEMAKQARQIGSLQAALGGAQHVETRLRAEIARLEAERVPVAAPAPAKAEPKARPGRRSAPKATVAPAAAPSGPAWWPFKS